MAVRTNRDLYAQLTGLVVQRDLETYLRAVLALGRDLDPREPDVDEVARLLCAASTAEPAEFEAAWLSAAPASPPASPSGRARFESILRQQIADLRRMRDNGQLADDHRYFGLDAPGGARWHNFDPRSYLESGASGSVGGWPDDHALELVTPPAPIDDPARQRSFGWHGLCELLICGQRHT